MTDFDVDAVVERISRAENMPHDHELCDACLLDSAVRLDAAQAVQAFPRFVGRVEGILSLDDAIVQGPVDVFVREAQK